MKSLIDNHTTVDIIFFQKFIKLFFLYIFLEGAFRKWFLPSLSTPIILIRDFFVIFIITQGIIKKVYNFNSTLEKTLLGWTILIIFWIVLQSTINEINIGIYFVGFRNWVLYFWFSILIFRSFKDFNEFDKIIKVIIYTIIPISILVMFQHYLPTDHILNVQVTSGLKSSGPSMIFTVAEGIVRVTSTFSFTSGHGQYISFMTPLIFYFLIEREKKVSFFIKFILTFSFLACVFVSGSRGLVLNTIGMIIIALFFNKSGNSFIHNFLILFFISLICFLIFERAINVTLMRFESATDGIFFYERIFDTLLPSPSTWYNYTILGKGIGLGSNMSQVFTGSVYLLGENEADRIIGEGGFIGILFYMFKIIISIYCINKAKKIYQKNHFAMPLYFSIYTAIQLTLHPVTAQITTHAFSSLSLGFLLLMINVYPIKKKNYIDYNSNKQHH